MKQTSLSHTQSPLHHAAPLPCGQFAHDDASCPPHQTGDGVAAPENMDSAPSFWNMSATFDNVLSVVIAITSFSVVLSIKSSTAPGPNTFWYQKRSASRNLLNC